MHLAGCSHTHGWTATAPSFPFYPVLLPPPYLPYVSLPPTMTCLTFSVPGAWDRHGQDMWDILACDFLVLSLCASLLPAPRYPFLYLRRYIT